MEMPLDEIRSLLNLISKQVAKQLMPKHPDIKLIEPMESALLEYNGRKKGFEACFPVSFYNKGQTEGIIIIHEIFPEPVGTFNVAYSLYSDRASISPKVLQVKPDSMATFYVNLFIEQPLQTRVIDEIDYNITLYFALKKTALNMISSWLNFFRRKIQLVEEKLDFPLRLVLTNYEFEKSIH